MPSLPLTVLPFLLGFLSFFKIEFIGSASASEVLLVAAMPFYTNRMIKLMQDRRIRRLLVLGVLYFVALIIADIYRLNPAEDYLRGWARVGFTLLALVSLTAILNGEKRMAWLPFLVGWYLSPLGSILVYGVQAELYKFYLGTSVSAFSLLALGYLPAVLAPVAYALPLLATAIAFLSDSRSLAGMTLLAFIVVVLMARRQKLENLSTRKLILAALIIVLSTVGIVRFYSYATSRGYFGEVAYDKYMSQVSPGDDTLGSIIYGGRIEIYFTWPKIVESPFIGYGSWPKDWVYTHGRAAELNIPSLGALLGSRSNVDAGLIPSHSHIMGAWLEAGILGAVFWTYALWLTLRLLTSGHIAKVGKLWPIFTYVLVSFAWDLFFSPYGGGRRVWNGFVLAWIISVASELKPQPRVAKYPFGSRELAPRKTLRHLPKWR